jgi:transcriptional regulator with XRE-family HTH domain
MALLDGFGKMVERRRKNARPFISQTQLADKAGVSLRTISKVESGSQIDLETIEKISAAFGFASLYDLAEAIEGPRATGQPAAAARRQGCQPCPDPANASLR